MNVYIGTEYFSQEYLFKISLLQHRSFEFLVTTFESTYLETSMLADLFVGKLLIFALP